MSKHTPGDWVTWYELDEDGLITAAGVDTGDRAANICVTTENVEAADNDIKAANAQIIADTELIAAAPSLLEACEEALRIMHYIATGVITCDAMNAEDESNRACNILEAVIAKATGEVDPS